MHQPHSLLLPHPLDHPRDNEISTERLDLGDVQAELLSCGYERARGVLVEPLE